MNLFEEKRMLDLAGQDTSFVDGKIAFNNLLEGHNLKLDINNKVLMEGLKDRAIEKIREIISSESAEKATESLKDLVSKLKKFVSAAIIVSLMTTAGVDEAFANDIVSNSSTNYTQQEMVQSSPIFGKMFIQGNDYQNTKISVDQLKQIDPTLYDSINSNIKEMEKEGKMILIVKKDKGLDDINFSLSRSGGQAKGPEDTIALSQTFKIDGDNYTAYAVKPINMQI